MQLLELIFQSFWHFIGALMLLGTGLHGIAIIVSAMTGSQKPPRPLFSIISIDNKE